MSNAVIPKRSSTASAVPTAGQLQVGEIAVNLADAKIYSKTAGGAVIQLGGGSSTSTMTQGKSMAIAGKFFQG